eukprot:jgi/Mesvir1/8579/Mv08876-RA.1
MEKLDEDDLNPCQQEFNFAKNKKGVKFMIPIVMEKAMLTKKNWDGVLSMILGEKMFVSMVQNAEIESNMHLVLNELAAIGITPSHGSQAPVSAAERNFAVDVAHLSREPKSKSEPPAGNATGEVRPAEKEKAGDVARSLPPPTMPEAPQQVAAPATESVTTPLHDAAKEGRLDDVRRLITAGGADKNAKDEVGASFGSPQW